MRSFDVLSISQTVEDPRKLVAEASFPQLFPSARDGKTNG